MLYLVPNDGVIFSTASNPRYVQERTNSLRSREFPRSDLQASISPRTRTGKTGVFPSRPIPRLGGAAPPKRGSPSLDDRHCGNLPARMVHYCTIGWVAITFKGGYSHEAFDQTSDVDRSGCGRPHSRGDRGGPPAHARGQRGAASP